MSEMVERVARAIDPVAWKWIDATREVDVEHLALSGTVAHQEKQARAAIEAMREPTSAMLRVGTDMDEGATLLPDDWWRAMVNEALRDP